MVIYFFLTTEKLMYIKQTLKLIKKSEDFIRTKEFLKQQNIVIQKMTFSRQKRGRTKKTNLTMTLQKTIIYIWILRSIIAQNLIQTRLT